MKKILIPIILFLSSGFCLSNKCQISNQEKYVISKIEIFIIKNSHKKWEIFLNKIENKIQNLKNSYSLTSKQKCLFWKIFEIIKKQKRFLIREKNLKKYQKRKEEIYKKEKEVKNINMEKVRKKWLEWNNKAREKKWLWKYRYIDILNRTSYLHSKKMLKNNLLEHTKGNKNWYEYNLLNQRFDRKWLDFANIWGFTHTENIGAIYINCQNNSKDCTEEVIKKLKGSFDKMMAEKKQKYKLHYQSIICQNFKQIGFALKIEPKAQKAYFTVHYASKIINHKDQYFFKNKN